MIWTACFTTRLRRRGLSKHAGPAQVLFERFAAEAGLPVNRRSPLFRKSVRQRFWRNAIAPLRALAFPIVSLCYRLIGKTDKSAAYEKVARYWLDYICNTPSRRRLHRQRSQEISRMKFGFTHRRLFHEGIAFHRRYAKLYHELVPLEKSFGTGAC